MPVLVRTEPFRELDRFFQQMFGGSTRRIASMAMPMDAYRHGDHFLLQFDLPGVETSSIDLTVDNNTLVVKAERPMPRLQEETEPLVVERPYGTFTRQVYLGDNLDTSRIDAQYDAGVLTLSIPVAEQAKPRRIEVRAADSAGSSTAVLTS